MGGVMEDITNATYPQYRSVCCPNPSSLFLFVCSVARTNLEIELIQRDPLFKSLKKKSCFVPLFNVLSLHSSLLSQTRDKNEKMDFVSKVWTRLTRHVSPGHSVLALFEVKVPMLLRDPIALLLQIILALPKNLDKAYFRCVIQALFNLLFIQSLVQLSCSLKKHHRDELQRLLHTTKITKDGLSGSSKDLNEKNISKLLGYIICSAFEDSPLYLDDEEISSKNLVEDIDPSTLENRLQKYCLHFLKIAALLQSHLYEETIQIQEEDRVFPRLCQYLGLSTETETEFTIMSCLDWFGHECRVEVDSWCQELTSFVNTDSSIAARELVQQHIQLNPPSLLDLPYNYDDVFKYYHKKVCNVCQCVPKDPSLCLVCGTMVCLRENCCRKAAHYEAVLHSVSCGAGTAIYLAVNSSTIIVIRGTRACLWGSVYLDSYGEEDRDLKRGKPLFLSKERYSLLKKQWINHSFDHTSKRWVWHRGNL